MEWLLQKIADYKEKTAIICDGKRFTYANLFTAIQQYSRELTSSSIKPREVVAIVSDYSFYVIAAFLALARNKNIVVPIASSLNSEIEEKIVVSRAEYAITFVKNSLHIKKTNVIEKEYKLINELKQQNNSGLILFSSGTTGKPKAMIHNLDALVDSFKNKKEKKLTLLLFLMFDHIGGLNTLLNAISMGITIVIPANRDSEYVCSIIEKYAVEAMPVSPTFLNLILISESYKRYNLSSLKKITYGTEPMPESLLLRLKEIFPHTKIWQTFGTSETGIAHVSSLSSSSTYIKIEDDHIETKVVDNELWLRSKTQILGYLNASMERFTADGWFKTGDIVDKKENGYLKIIGRNSDIINVGGQKVLPGEVEETILKMPQIAACMVYGEKSAITGQIVVADIVLSRSSAPSIENIRKELRLFLKTQLEPYKIPVKINIKNTLPHTNSFKTKRYYFK